MGRSFPRTQWKYKYGLIPVPLDVWGCCRQYERLDGKVLIPRMDLRAVGEIIYRLEADAESANRGQVLGTLYNTADGAHIAVVKRLPVMGRAKLVFR